MIALQVDASRFERALDGYALAAGKSVDEIRPRQIVNWLIKARNLVKVSGKGGIAERLRGEHKLWSWYARHAAEKAGVSADYASRPFDLVWRKSKKRGRYQVLKRASRRAKWYTLRQWKAIKRANINRRKAHTGFNRALLTRMIDGIRGREGDGSSIHFDSRENAKANAGGKHVRFRVSYEWAHSTTLARQPVSEKATERDIRRAMDDALPETIADIEQYTAKRIVRKFATEAA